MQADGTAALDIAPAWAFGQSRSVSPADYQSSLFDQWLFKTRLGFALYRGDDGGGDATKQKVSKAAVSVSLSLLPTDDPITATQPGQTESAWNSCLTNNFEKILAASHFRFPAGDPQRLVNLEGALIVDASGGVSGLDSAAKTKLSSDLNTAEALFITVTGKDASGKGQTELADRFAKDQIDIGGYISTVPKDETAADTQLTGVLSGCQKEASVAAQHGADLQVALGVVESGTPGQLESFSSPNFAAWLSGRLPIGYRGIAADCGDQDKRDFFALMAGCSLVGFSAQYSLNETDATGNKALPQTQFNVTNVWGGLEQVNSKWTLGAYIGYTDQQAVNSIDSKYSKSGTRWLVNAGYQLSFVADGVWLVASYGAASGNATTLDDKTFTLSLDLSPPKVNSLIEPTKS